MRGVYAKFEDISEKNFRTVDFSAPQIQIQTPGVKSSGMVFQKTRNVHMYKVKQQNLLCSTI